MSDRGEKIDNVTDLEDAIGYPQFVKYEIENDELIYCRGWEGNINLNKEDDRVLPLVKKVDGELCLLRAVNDIRSF